MSAGGSFVGVARAIYAYAAQTPDELSIDEDDVVYVIEKGEDDWWKVKQKPAPGQDEGPFGLVPSNYLEPIPPLSKAVTLYEYNRQTDEEISFPEDVQVDVFDKDDPDWFFVHHQGEYGFAPSNYLEEINTNLPRVSTPEQSIQDSQYPNRDPTRDSILLPQDQAPRLFTREPQSPSPLQSIPNAYRNPQDHYAVRQSDDSFCVTPPMPKGVKTWPVQEIHKKNKKKKATLGLGNDTVIIATKDEDGLQQWPVTSIVEYSSERKHVFIDLASPPKAASFDFHAGSKEIADQIVSAIGEMVGAVRAPGLREIAAASGAPMDPLPESSALAHRNQLLKKGILLYDFVAQGDDELSVKAEQEVVILDDYSNEDWWKCRAGKREGVIPSSYIEVKTKLAKPTKKDSEVTRNRESLVSSRQRSLTVDESQKQHSQKPDMNKVREWTDRTRSFKVEAQFLGCAEGKIHLHKTNGVKIAVPVQKMSIEDINFVERVTGKSLKEDKPLVELKREPKTKSNFDWFEFFLACEIDHNLCQRYTLNFEKDDIDESLIPDLTPDVLRTLGVKEGHILRIMRHIESKYGKRKSPRNVSFGGAQVIPGAHSQSKSDQERDLLKRPLGDEKKLKDSLQSVITIDHPSKPAQPLFSNGPDGTLRNNTRKGRPQQTRSVSDTVDPNAFKQNTVPATVAERIISSAGAAAPVTCGFDDDAWTPKPVTSHPKPVSSTNLDDLITLESSSSAQPVPFNPTPPSQSQIVQNTTPNQPQYNALLFQPSSIQTDSNSGIVARSRPTSALSPQNVSSVALKPVGQQPTFLSPDTQFSQPALAQRMQHHVSGLQNYTLAPNMIAPMSAGFTGFTHQQMAGFPPRVGSFPAINQPLTVHRTGPPTFNQQPSTILSHSPLIPQSTGFQQQEFRPVLFGAPVQKPMPTGQRANLAAATPENPFGLT